MARRWLAGGSLGTGAGEVLVKDCDFDERYGGFLGPLRREGVELKTMRRRYGGRMTGGRRVEYREGRK